MLNHDNPTVREFARGTLLALWDSSKLGTKVLMLHVVIG
jgi:hypothetical protein